MSSVNTNVQSYIDAQYAKLRTLQFRSNTRNSMLLKCGCRQFSHRKLGNYNNKMEAFDRFVYA